MYTTTYMYALCAKSHVMTYMVRAGYNLSLPRRKKQTFSTTNGPGLQEREVKEKEEYCNRLQREITMQRSVLLVTLHS